MSELKFINQNAEGRFALGFLLTIQCGNATLLMSKEYMHEPLSLAYISLIFGQGTRVSTPLAFNVLLLVVVGAYLVLYSQHITFS